MEDRKVLYAMAKEQRTKLCEDEVGAVLKEYGCTPVVQEVTVKVNGQVASNTIKVLFVPAEDITPTEIKV